MLERSDDPDRPFNTLVVVDPDGLRASYRKIHLYDSFGFEREGLRKGHYLRDGVPVDAILMAFQLDDPS